MLTPTYPSSFPSPQKYFGPSRFWNMVEASRGTSRENVQTIVARWCGVLRDTKCTIGQLGYAKRLRCQAHKAAYRPVDWLASRRCCLSIGKTVKTSGGKPSPERHLVGIWEGFHTTRYQTEEVGLHLINPRQLSLYAPVTLPE